MKEKLEIPGVVDRNPKRKRADTAKELGLMPSTLNSMVAKRAEIEAKAVGPNLDSKKSRGAKHGDLETVLLKQFQQARGAKVNFNGSALREKVMEIATHLGISSFTASNGWTNCFKNRQGISYNTVCGRHKCLPVEVVASVIDRRVAKNV